MTFRGQFLIALLAASILAFPMHAPAQASSKPRIVPPPVSVRPLEVGPAVDPRDQIELSPMPVDYEVEHPLLVGITVFKEEPLPSDQIHGSDPSSRRYYNWIIYVSTDGTLGSTAWWGDKNTSNGGPLSSATRIPEDSFKRIKALVATLPPDDGRIPPRNHKIEVEIATPHGTVKRMYDASSPPDGLLEVFRLTDSNFTPLPK